MSDQAGRKKKRRRSNDNDDETVSEEISTTITSLHAFDVDDRTRIGSNTYTGRLPNPVVVSILALLLPAYGFVYIGQGATGSIMLFFLLLTGSVFAALTG